MENEREREPKESNSETKVKIGNSWFTTDEIQHGFDNFNANLRQRVLNQELSILEATIEKSNFVGRVIREVREHLESQEEETVTNTDRENNERRVPPIDWDAWEELEEEGEDLSVWKRKVERAVDLRMK